MQLERHVLFWIAAAIVTALMLQVLAPVLLPFVIGLALAYFLNPIVDRLSAWKVPRWLSAAFLLLVAICLIVATFVFVVPVLAQQTASLIAAAPAELTRLKGMIEASARARLGTDYPEAEMAVSRMLDSITTALPGLATAVAQQLWSQGSAAFNFLSLVLVTPLVLFYTLLDWPKLLAKIDTWLPRDNAFQIRAIAAEIDERVSAFFRGQGTVCVILAIFYAAALNAWVCGTGYWSV